MVTYDNYEEYLILDADDELSMEEKAELESFLILNPDLRDEAEMWKDLKLDRHSATVFPDKVSLLRFLPESTRNSVNIEWLLNPDADTSRTMTGEESIQLAESGTDILYREKKTRLIKPGTRVIIYRHLVTAAAGITGLLILIPAIIRFTGDQRQQSFAHVFDAGSPKDVVAGQTTDGVKTNGDQQPHLTAHARNTVAIRNNAIKNDATVKASPSPDFLSALAIISSLQGTEIPTVVSPLLVQSTERVELALSQPAPSPQQHSGFPRLAFAEDNQLTFDLLKRVVDIEVRHVAATDESPKEIVLEVKLGKGFFKRNF